MKYESKLSKFLKDNRCYTEFTKAIKRKYKQSLEQYCDTTDVRRYISSGIDWDNTKKGLDLWVALNKKWINNE